MSPCLYCYSCLLCTAAAKVPGWLYEREALSCLFCWHQWSCKVLKAKGQSWTHIYTRARLSVKTFQLRQGEEACEDRKSKVVYCVVLFVSGGFFLFVFFHSRAKRGAVKMRVSGEERRSRSADGDGERYRQPERMKNRCREGEHPLLFEQPRSWRKYKQTVVTDWVSQNMSQCWCYKIYCFVWPVHLDGKTYTLCIYINKSLLVFK